MSSESHTHFNDRLDEQDHESSESDASAGWCEEYEFLCCPTSVEPEHLEAMYREDRPESYRRKHRLGVTS